jgi:hypothetical protein
LRRFYKFDEKNKNKYRRLSLAYEGRLSEMVQEMIDFLRKYYGEVASSIEA